MLAMEESQKGPGSLEHMLDPEHQDADSQEGESDQSLAYRDCASGSKRDMKNATVSGVHVERDVKSADQSEQDVKSSTLSEQDLRSLTLSELNVLSLTLSELNVKSVTLSEIDFKSDIISERDAKSATLSGREINQTVNNKPFSDPDVTPDEQTNALSEPERTRKHKENPSDAVHTPRNGRDHGAPDEDYIRTKDKSPYTETPKKEFLLNFDSSGSEQNEHVAEAVVDATGGTERAPIRHFSQGSQGRDGARYYAEHIGCHSPDDEHLSDELHMIENSPGEAQVHADGEGRYRQEEYATGHVESETLEEGRGETRGPSSSQENHEKQETSLDRAAFTDKWSICAQPLHQEKLLEREKQLKLGADQTKKKDADAFFTSKIKHNREQENTRLWVEQNARNMPLTIRKEMSEPETKKWNFSYSIDEAEIPPSEEVETNDTSPTADVMVYVDRDTQRTGSQTGQAGEKVQAGTTALEVGQKGNTISNDDANGQGKKHRRIEEQEKRAGKEDGYETEKENSKILEEDERGKKDKEGEILFHFMLYSDAESSDDYDYEDGTCLTVDRPRMTARDSWDWTFPDVNVSDLDVKYDPRWESDKLTLDDANAGRSKGAEMVVDETGAGSVGKMDTEGGKLHLEEDIIENEGEQIGETQTKELVMERLDTAKQKEIENKYIDETAEKKESKTEHMDGTAYMKESEVEQIDDTAEKNEVETEQVDKTAKRNDTEFEQINETTEWTEKKIEQIYDIDKNEETECDKINGKKEFEREPIYEIVKNQEFQSKEIEETDKCTNNEMEQTDTTAENEKFKRNQMDENIEKSETKTEQIADENREEKKNEIEQVDETAENKQSILKKTNKTVQVHEIADQGNTQIVTLNSTKGGIQHTDSNTREMNIKVKDKGLSTLGETKSEKKTKVNQWNRTIRKTGRKAVRWHEAWATEESKTGKEGAEIVGEASEIFTVTLEPNQQLEQKAQYHSSDSVEMAGISADDLMREYEHQLNEREKNGEVQKQEPLSHYNVLPAIRPKRGKTSSEDEDIVYFENDAQMSVRTRLRYLSGNMDIGEKSTTVAESIKQKRNCEKENRRKAKKEFEHRNIKRTVSKLDHLEARFIQRHLHTPDTSLLDDEDDEEVYHISPYWPTFMSVTGTTTPLQSPGRNPSISLDKSIGLMKYIRRRTMSRDWAVTKHEMAHLKALNTLRMTEDKACSDEQLDRKSQMTPLQRFRHAGRMITVMLRAVGWKPQTVVEEDYNFLSWTIVYDEVLGISRLNYDKQGLTFDPLAFKASKESTITQDIKDILQLPSDQRTDENIRSVIRAFYNLVPAFGEFPIKIQQSMLKVCTYEKFKTGRVIIRQGHRAENFYFIISGCAVVTEMDSGGSHVHTANILGKGNSFGELAFLNMSQRSATVTCREDVELLCIEREDFIDIFLRGSTGKDPEHLAFLKTLDIFKGWPVDKLPRDNPKICAATYVRRGVILCHESSNSNWIFVVVTGSCKVLKALDKEVRRAPPSARRKPTRRRDVSGLEMTPSPQSIPEICISGDDLYLGPDDASWSALPSPRSGHLRPVHEHTVPSRNGLTSGPYNSGNLFRQRTDTEVRLCELDHLNKIEQIFFTKHILPSIQDLKPTREEQVQPTPRSRKVSTVLKPGTMVETISASRLKRNSYGLHPPHLPQIATCASRASCTSHGEPVGEKVFIEIVRLESGDVFGLDHVLLDDMRKLTSCSLVSDGAEVVLMDKKYFRKHLTEETAKRMRQMVRPVPSERVLRRNLKTKDSWEAFKATSMAKRLGVARTGLSASSGS